MIPNIMSINLQISPEELAATIEALHDTILRRLRWTIYPGHQHWKGLEWEIVREVVSQLVQAYTKAMMSFRELEVPVNPNFVKVFGFPTETWDLLAEISVAQNWSEAPVHKPCECPACSKILGDRS